MQAVSKQLIGHLQVILSIKYQSSASLAFVRGIHRGPVNSPHKWPVKRKMFPFDDVIMIKEISLSSVAFRAWISHPLKPWNIIIHKQKNTHISLKKIYFQEKFINDQTEIANTFNDFFINIGPNLTKNIIQKDHSNISYRKYNNASILSFFNFQLIDDESLRKTLSSLRTKSSSGYDGISTRLWKFLAPALVSPLGLIINQSLITGIYPDKLKTAKVIPLYKKGDKAKCHNYRPISLLCAISKLFEKVVYNELYDYFTKNKLFHDNQYGFRTKHSTELAVTELIDRMLLNIDNKQVPFAVFMDLSKTFDMLDHKILIDKLQHYGIGGISLMWFESYLSKRTQ